MAKSKANAPIATANNPSSTIRRVELPCGADGVGCLDGEVVAGGLLGISGNQEGDPGEGTRANKTQVQPSGGLQCTVGLAPFPPLEKKSPCSPFRAPLRPIRIDRSAGRNNIDKDPPVFGQVDLRQEACTDPAIA